MENKLRLRYSKVGKSKYLSHLDLSATLRRAMIRAGVSLKYSEGFNPHPYMSVALPLSVGTESVCELMDVGIAEGLELEGLPERVNRCLPEGIKIAEAYFPSRKFSEIAWVEMSGFLYYDESVPYRACERLSARYSLDCIEVKKRTKKGESIIDIASFVCDMAFSESDNIEVAAKLSAQNPTINPANVMDALAGEYEELAPDFTSFKRLELFDSGMKVFR
ncbi:MAG: TIGR03936 family radical SAM-associated protein [Oscillospiraceae bacterium]|nr:TIGR03936 family radical SAM-associated protein [Oscillospiraceae bacterium]